MYALTPALGRALIGAAFALTHASRLWRTSGRARGIGARSSREVYDAGTERETGSHDQGGR
jgi:hypothetical protein